MGESFYDVLGVPADASTDEIRSAYRERLKRTHPDVSDAPDATEATERLIEARDVLVDEDERDRYDRLGHDAYVAEAEGYTADQSDVSDAARAARQAGWGEPGTGEAGPTNDRASASERRQRERRANERVGDDRRRSGGHSSGPGQRMGADAAGVGGSATGGGPSGTGGPHASGSSWTGNVGTGSAWISESGFDPSDVTEEGLLWSRLFPPQQSLSLLVVTFVFYPVLLFSSLFPPFPLVVNVLVGVCTLLVIAYLQSIPEAGVLVFGTWSLLSPVALFALGIDPGSIVGLALLCGTWLPFGFSYLTYSIVRP